MCIIYYAVGDARVNTIYYNSLFSNINYVSASPSMVKFQNVVHISAATTLGHPFCKQQDCFDENDEEIKMIL